MKKYEVIREIQKGADVETNGFHTIEAPNLFRAVVVARKREIEDYDDAIANGDNYYYYPDWLEVWEVDDGAYTSVRRYVFPMR